MVKILKKTRGVRMSFELVVGKTKMRKTDYIKLRLREISKPIVILDFKNEYNGLDGATYINLGVVDPFKLGMDYNQIEAVNAASLEYVRTLNKYAEDILREQTIDGEDWEKTKVENLIYQTLDRAVNSWNRTDNTYIESIKKRLLFNKSKQTESIEDIARKIMDNKLVVIQTESLHSMESRIIMYLLLLELQKNDHLFTFISDNINSMWKEGHLFNFTKIFDFRRIDCVFVYNRIIDVPSKLLELVTCYTVFKLDGNEEYRLFKKIVPPLKTSAKYCGPGEYNQYYVDEERFSFEETQSNNDCYSPRII